MSNQRRKYPPEKKVEILREYLKNKVPISELCEKYGAHPNMFYKWEKQLFEGATDVLLQMAQQKAEMRLLAGTRIVQLMEELRNGRRMGDA